MLSRLSTAPARWRPSTHSRRPPFGRRQRLCAEADVRSGSMVRRPRPGRHPSDRCTDNRGFRAEGCPRIGGIAPRTWNDCAGRSCPFPRPSGFGGAGDKASDGIPGAPPEACPPRCSRHQRRFRRLAPLQIREPQGLNVSGACKPSPGRPSRVRCTWPRTMTTRTTPARCGRCRWAACNKESGAYSATDRRRIDSTGRGHGPGRPIPLCRSIPPPRASAPWCWPGWRTKA